MKSKKIFIPLERIFLAGDEVLANAFDSENKRFERIKQNIKKRK